MEKNIKWSGVFKKVQLLQAEFASVINDISVSESSLEDIFLKIAQDEDRQTANIQSNL